MPVSRAKPRVTSPCHGVTGNTHGNEVSEAQVQHSNHCTTVARILKITCTPSFPLWFGKSISLSLLCLLRGANFTLSSQKSGMVTGATCCKHDSVRELLCMANATPMIQLVTLYLQSTTTFISSLPLTS